MRILAVDDEADTRKLIKALLTPHGHHVVSAASALEAMAHVRMEDFDLILLDIMMPGMDGHQFAQTVVNNWQTFEIPIVVVSCRTDGESKSWARLNGCVGYLEKPFSPSDLIDIIAQVGRSRSR